VTKRVSSAPYGPSSARLSIAIAAASIALVSAHLARRGLRRSACGRLAPRLGLEAARAGSPKTPLEVYGHIEIGRRGVSLGGNLFGQRSRKRSVAALLCGSCRLRSTTGMAGGFDDARLITGLIADSGGKHGRATRF